MGCQASLASSFCPLLISLEIEENSERREARLGAPEEFELLFKALSSRNRLFLSIVSKKLLRNKDCQRILKELPFFAKAEVYRDSETLIYQNRGVIKSLGAGGIKSGSRQDQRRHKRAILGLVLDFCERLREQRFLTTN